MQLYKAFGWQAPEFIHMLLLRNADKSKISKRKNPVSLNFYERAGFLPEAMLNYLALMGWTLPDQREKFPIEDMIEHFSFDRISLGGPVFDLPKRGSTACICVNSTTIATSRRYAATCFRTPT